MRILVSIISEQTLPNLLLIKELKGQYDCHLFISTEKMEALSDLSNSRSRWIERAAGIEEGSTDRVIVVEDNWTDIQSKLEMIQGNYDDNYLVNLTGGTKVMTLAIYNFFSKPGNRIVYSSIGKNQYAELFPSLINKAKPINYCVSLSEYLWVHGLFFQMDSEPKFTPAQTSDLFYSLQKMSFDINGIPEIKNAHSAVNDFEKVYFSGGWFEEYIFNFFRKKLNLSSSRIAMSVKLFHNQDDIKFDNEFDLMFIRNNQLFVLQCKMSCRNSKFLRTNVDKYLYKLGAITKDFGLQVNSFLVTLSNLSSNDRRLLDNIDNRRKILGIKEIIDQKYFMEDNSINSIIKTMQL